MLLRNAKLFLRTVIFFQPKGFKSSQFSTMPNLKIGTHSGTFHCDEVLACFMLKTLPEYKDATIVRTRDESILDTCDIVVDVGGKYDPSTHRYDHHMRDFKESVNTVLKKPGFECDIKLSSAGLIYCHFGERIINNLLPELDKNDLEKVHKKVYETLIKEIDGIDNGVPMFEGEPLYRTHTDLSSRVSKVNSPWNQPSQDQDILFQEAMLLAGEDFLQAVDRASKIWLPARRIVKEAVEKRFEVHPSGEVIELLQMAPWKEHLFDLEKEMNISPTIKFIIYQENQYRVLAVPVQSGSFICRKFLPSEWRGRRDAELVKYSGIDGCVFVHTTGFTGGNLTREGIMKMVDIALKTKDTDN